MFPQGSAANPAYRSRWVGDRITSAPSISTEATPERLPWRLVAVVSVLIVGTTRWATRSHFLFNWDAVNFGLAVERIDLARHQPHPPASLGFVLAGRMFGRFTPDVNAALVAWNIAAATVACGLMFALAFHLTPRLRVRHGWAAWAVLASSVQFWFYADVAEIYMSELAATLLVAFCALRTMRGSSAAAYAGAAALAIAGAFRLTGMIFMTPLCAYALWRAPIAKKKWRVGLLFGVAVAAWLIPVLGLFGSDYLTLIRDQFSAATRDPGEATGGLMRPVSRNARDVLYSLIAGVGVFNVAAALVLTARRPSLRAHVPWTFLLLWTLPSLAVFVFVHMGKFGYTLMLAPIACLLVAHVYVSRTGRRMLAALLVVQLIAGGVHFIYGRPATGERIGDGRLYRHKTAAQKFFTEANALFFPTWSSIRESDSALAWTMRRIAACEPGDGVASTDLMNRPAPIIVTTDGDGMMDWRKAMYYEPEAISIRVPRRGEGPFFVASGRFSAGRDDPTLMVRERCRTFWLLPPDHMAIAALRDQARLRTVTAGGWTMYETNGPATVPVTPTRVLQIR